MSVTTLPRPSRHAASALAGGLTLFLRRLEVPVVLRDLDQDIVDRALASIRTELEGAAARGRMTEDKANFLASIATGSTTYDGFADCDLVLEAVVEEMEVKQRVFSKLRGVVGADCVDSCRVAPCARGYPVGTTPRRVRLGPESRRESAPDRRQ